MKIEQVHVVNYRNFSDAVVNFSASTLIIGANDVGKTNLVHGIRLLLDKSFSERDIEPSETDFHIRDDGTQADDFSISIRFDEVKEDAVLSILKGHVSDDAKTVFKIVGFRKSLDYKIFVGESESELEEVTGRYYLKYINLRYVNAQRNLHKFIETEKKHLLKISQNEIAGAEREADLKQLSKIGRSLNIVNDRVRKLNYVKDSTSLVNSELKKLAHTYHDYEVHLDSGSIQVQQFIDGLKLNASTNGSKMLLGGDGRNNQILLALWKAKSQREFDPDHEVVIYCIEEPEAHLHPHQQRKLANYLINELQGQTILTSHSPQITEQYTPDSIINIIKRGNSSYAASNGCSDCISESWDSLGYRMSILPAEAFFAKAVLLVEGPSEKLFYTELAKSLNINLDYYNISILSVDGVQFEVYVNVLKALEVPWVIRTDNDVFKITEKKEEKRNLAGINRCLSLTGFKKLEHRDITTTSASLVEDDTWATISKHINPRGAYLAKVDLETDLSYELPNELLAYTGKEELAEAISYLAEKKAIRMREFLVSSKDSLKQIAEGELARPLFDCVKKAKL
ncbi:AAA family ATPase [Vibrio parahaemolyticus]|uniref:ATP-dependent nuclease n=1 Tax=Vibrio cholerae TaxID=666 RepID=UPI0011D3ED9D|nr:AAA family ATPase [Vibrio cholerae]MBE3966030.1 AAA family ATPase [Vibrio parahaemolyticus]MBY7805014.1 AAA family ATPase [Vibrio fluvialis]MBE4023793.1 AAA family ATPase [Vibrio parahaemolyticus]MBY7896544.1 AAA family ATPase [Vibrio fluvialis]TXY64466.1 AAA family ATPase [Vibrio cholerae]